MTKKILISGSAGFIGNYIARSFSANGYKIYGTYRNIFPANLSGDNNIELLWTDFRDLSQLPKQYDILIHCATDTPAIINALAQENVSDILNFENIFSHAAKANASLIVYLSSISIYGKVKVDILDETVPVELSNNYALSKYLGENALQKIVSYYKNLAGLTIRLPGVVGAGSKHNFLSRIIYAIFNGENIMAVNPTALFNNVIYVGDLADFLLLYIKQYSIQNTQYELTNIAAEQPLSIQDIIQYLQDLIGKKCNVIFNASNDKPFLIALDKIKSLGYCPPSVYASLQNFVTDNSKFITN